MHSLNDYRDEGGGRGYNNQPVMGAAKGRREDGGRDSGRGGGCSGDSLLCGGSGSGDGDSNVAAATAMTAMCGKRG